MPIVEIGAGLGDLTKYLLKLNHVISYEIDFDLVPILQQKFSDEISREQLRLVPHDILDCWDDTHLLDQEYQLIANLPYYVATNIILKALKDTNCKSIVVLIQKEVAQKFAAKNGEKSFSALSILASSIAQVELVFDVEAKYFDPPPKVVSSVIKIEKYDTYDNDFIQKSFDEFLRNCFAFPRKTIGKNLGSSYEKEAILALLEKYEIPTTLRPHQIDIEKYHILYKEIKGFPQ